MFFVCRLSCHGTTASREEGWSCARKSFAEHKVCKEEVCSFVPIFLLFLGVLEVCISLKIRKVQYTRITYFDLSSPTHRHCVTLPLNNAQCQRITLQTACFAGFQIFMNSAFEVGALLAHTLTRVFVCVKVDVMEPRKLFFFALLFIHKHVWETHVYLVHFIQSNASN